MHRQPSREELVAAGNIVPADAVVAIDGPAGSGKSTTAKALARRLGLVYVDTGAMYRALTRAALDAGVSPENEAELSELLSAAKLELRPGDKESQVYWNGRDVSKAIRTAEVDSNVSAVAAHGSVRRQMVELQREFGRQGGVVMEGRDIGSVVFPLASTKIYLDASAEARADRRWKQNRERGIEHDKQAVLDDLIKRDKLDSEREESPLTISPDAIVLDSSDWSLERQLDEAALACRVNPWMDARIDWDAEKAWRPLSPKYKIFFGFLRLVMGFLGMKVMGRPQPTVPAGTILASNHVAWSDPPVVGGIFNRGPIRTLAKEELFKGPVLRGFFNWLDCIPINRRGYDERAFDMAREALEQGQNLFMFPEGTRRIPGQPGPVKGGLGILAQVTRAPIQPIFVRGTCALAFGGNPQSPLEVRYGPLVRLHALDRLLAELDRKEVTKRIGTMFQSMLEEMQARSFGDFAETGLEKKLRAKQERRILKKRPFGEGPPAGS